MTASASGPQWREIPAHEVSGWNQRLQDTDAELFQYPLWNEALRILRFKPRYLVCVSGGEEIAFAAVLQFGVPGFRLGLVRRGPVNLREGQALPASVFASLRDWLRQLGLVFIRISHSAPAVLECAAAMGPHQREDAFPFLHEVDHDLIVPLQGDESAIAGDFSATARRKIRKAQQAGFVITWSDSPEALRESWPLFERLSMRKRRSLQPVARFAEMVRLARPYGCVRTYQAFLRGQLVQSILIARERDTARFIVGALDVESLGTTPSPSCYLHWVAMCDARQQGCLQYSLGTRSGIVYEFKRQFHPHKRTLPPPVTLIMAPVRYAIWSAVKHLLFPRWHKIKEKLFRPHGTLVPVHRPPSA